jgi:hypothetical protein
VNLAVRRISLSLLASLTLPDLWSRADAVRQVAPGLGPPRPAQHELHLAASLAQTVLRESFSRSLTQMGWRSGFPTGRPWDFAFDRLDPSDCTRATCAASAHLSVRCDLPDPIPRITCPSPHLRAALGLVGSDAWRSAGLSPAVPREVPKHFPAASHAATLTRPASGPFRAH